MKKQAITRAIKKAQNKKYKMKRANFNTCKILTFALITSILTLASLTASEAIKSVQSKTSAKEQVINSVLDY